MTPTPFIQSHECLLIFVDHEDGRYIPETNTGPMSLQEALHSVESAIGEVWKIHRYDLESMTGEDVAEELASAWLTTFEGGEEDVPSWIATTDAWDGYVDEMATDAIYGTPNEQVARLYYATR